MADVKYFLLSDVNLNVKIKINALKGVVEGLGLKSLGDKQHAREVVNTDAEMYVTVAICAGGRVLGLPESTSFQCFPATGPFRWNEWLTFAMKYKDLPPKACLALTVWSAGCRLQDGSVQHGPWPVGGTTFPLFCKKGLLKLGHRKLYVWRDREADPSEQTLTPYKKHKAHGTEKLEKIIRSYDQKVLPKIQWLDNLSLRRIEKVQEKAHQQQKLHESLHRAVIGSPTSLSEASKSAKLGTKGLREDLPPTAKEFLDLMRPDHLKFGMGLLSVDNTIPNEIDEDALLLSVNFPTFKHPIVFHQNPCRQPSTLKDVLPFEASTRLFVLHDLEVNNSDDNPVSKMYHKLARSSKGLADRELKPNNQERVKIAEIINSPNKHLASHEKMLLWNFRYSLIDDKRALTKFLRAVDDWTDANEAKHAMELVERWAAIDIADALELLSAYFTNASVRRYAVTQLDRADNEELASYLLQLVQALRYETRPSVLAKFLLRRCVQTLELANFFHWYLMVEKDDKVCGQMYSALHEEFLERLMKAPNGPEWHKELQAQGDLISSLIGLGEAAKAKKKYVKERIEQMRQLLSPSGDMKRLRRFPQPVTMSVRPEVKVNGICASECTMFKSALTPMLLSFHVDSSSVNSTSNDHTHEQVDKTKYKVIFKSGDDLRQDQLIIQMINLMDHFLKKVNLDLKLTPYRVLATSADDGFVEFVPHSYTMTSILNDYDKDIRKFFQAHNKSPKDLQSCLDTFVKSCAGYCVITYLLGIGDRHLDNVLLTETGHLFHIDFGYIFGRDPKPFPPPMKICKEMVDGMGGSDSKGYSDFRRYCCSAFNILRKHANLVLNLLGLMGDANIEALSDGLEKNLLKVQEKFRLDLTDEEAEQFLLSLIDDSVHALFPQLMERIHRWALYWR